MTDILALLQLWLVFLFWQANVCQKAQRQRANAVLQMGKPASLLISSVRAVTKPREFPPGTKEIRYYLKANGCTYLIGGFMATVGSGEPWAISQELFEEIITRFQVNP